MGYIEDNEEVKGGEYNIGWSLMNRIASNEIEKTQQEIIVIILIIDERSIDRSIRLELIIEIDALGFYGDDR